MIWIILTFVFGWLLCGAWALRMCELDGEVMIERGELPWVAYLFGPITLIAAWFVVWPPRIWIFCKGFSKGVIAAWKEAAK